MTIASIEQYISELLAAPTRQLSDDQQQIVFAFAEGLFKGKTAEAASDSPLSLSDILSLRALSQKHTFYVGYFAETSEGRKDARVLGIIDQAAEVVPERLLEISRIAKIPLEVRAEIAQRSCRWAREQLATQLLHDESTDETYLAPQRLTVNYDPDAILQKAAAVRSYQLFYEQVSRSLAREPDTRVVEAKRVVLELYAGRLRAMAAVDVLPAVLSLEDQLTFARPSAQKSAWEKAIQRAAPPIGALHVLAGEPRIMARSTYARHLDAIRQGAPYELDEVHGQPESFTAQTVADLQRALELLQKPADFLRKTSLGLQLEKVVWHAPEIKSFIEEILRTWDMLSEQSVVWAEVERRAGFAPDGKFQVVITPRRTHMTVDSVRRIVNVPETIARPLAGLYPAGALPLIAHELTHVLQAFADYELGRRIPLARIKGRRYRIVREAGGVYQESIMAKKYFGTSRRPNWHYLAAYQEKLLGRSRVAVARAFYESYVADRQLNAEEAAAARELAVDRTARLYRRGGYNSQVLDYLEQSVVCAVLLERTDPVRANAFLLGASSFNLEDSAALHRYGLLSIPTGVAYSPVVAVMDTFLSGGRGGR